MDWLTTDIVSVILFFIGVAGLIFKLSNLGIWPDITESNLSIT